MLPSLLSATAACNAARMAHINPNAAPCYRATHCKAKAKSGWAGGLKLAGLPASTSAQPSVVPLAVVPPVVGMSPT